LFGRFRTTSFSLTQAASDAGNAETLIFFLVDLLHLDGQAIGARPLKERKERIRDMLSQSEPAPAIQRSPDRARPGLSAPECWWRRCSLG
jgi:ATP-dependent DNA ligase